jgi:hypothetical protein
MFRVAVIAYLSLATVMGPSLCCCNARQLFAVAGTSTCCGQSTSTATAHSHSGRHKHQHGHGHKHSHGHEHVAADHPHSAAPGEQSPQKPCEHDDKNCPCGNRQAKLVAIPSGEGSHGQALELQSEFFNHLAVDLPVLPEFDVKEASTTAHIRPADLFGRDMLRAYQTLRC